jgi:hypothetical protein
MNNTKRTLAIFAILMATTLVVGTFATVAAAHPVFFLLSEETGTRQ